MNLEDLARERMAKLPGMDPIQMPNVPTTPAYSNSVPSSGSGLDSLLPMLMSLKSKSSQYQQPSSGTASHWENVAQRMATNRYGYTPGDFAKLDSIINRESNWDPNAVNQGSGAYGIPQILPSAHPNTHLENDPKGQIKWLLNYIDQRYGGIDQALAFKDANGWY